MTKWTEEQLRAINENDRNIIVSAGAGSGKTAVLTERVITKIKSGIKINELLVLTFTKAAAKEMKERIKKSLAKEEKLKEQLDLIDGAYITTFDSFSLSIVKKYHYLLNIPKNVSLLNDTVLEYKTYEFLNEIFNRLYEEENEDFLSLIEVFALKNENSLKKDIIKISKNLDLKEDKLKFLEEYPFFSNQEKDFEEFKNLVNSSKKYLRNYLEEISFLAGEELYQEMELAVNKVLDASYDELVNLNYADLGFPRTPNNADEELKFLKAKIKEELENILHKYCNYSKDEHFNLNKNSSKYIKIIIDIIKELELKLQEFKKEHNKYSFTDIAKMSIELVSNFPDAKEELKNQFKEIMLDEYQDTSDLQEILIGLISDNNVYMVGDIKQSIYQFRNANPDIFKDKYQSYLEDEEKGLKIDLNKNFRSRREVIDDINLIFSKLMTLDLGGADYQKNQEMIFGNLNYDSNVTKEKRNLRILNYENKEKYYSDEEIEIFTILRDIEDKIKNKYQVLDKETNKLRDITYADIAILIDRSKSFDLYKKIFEHHQIPLNKYTKTSVLESNEILLIKNLLILLNKLENKEYDNKFRYAYVSIARSYLSSISDNDIYHSLNNNQIFESSIIKTLREIDPNKYTVYQLLERLIQDFNFYEKTVLVADINERTYKLNFLLDIAKELDDLSYDYNDLISIIETSLKEEFKMEIEISPLSINSVKIMTIHHSKGLEYPLVYLSSLNKEFNRQELRDTILYSKDYGIILPVLDEAYHYSFYKDLYTHKYNLDLISERIRLFYVAMSRAKEQLILVTSFKKDCNDLGKAKSFLDFLAYSKDSLNDFLSEIDLNSLALNRSYQNINKFNYLNYIDSEESLEIDEYQDEIKLKDSLNYSKVNLRVLSDEDIRNIDEGNRLHYLLETIDLKNPKLENLELADQALVKNFLAQDLNLQEAKIYQEYEFILDDESRRYGVIDLLLEYENEFRIIDYKLKNTKDEAYLKQLNGYKEYIQTKTDKAVSIYLYSILDNELLKLD